MMFVFKPNPVTGSIEWVARKDDDQAFADDIAKYKFLMKFAALINNII